MTPSSTPTASASGTGDVGVRDCTLSVPDGRVVGLVGPNGAGKTTLLHLAVGLLTPTAGPSRWLADFPVTARHSWPGSVSLPRTRPPTPACRSPSTYAWGPT